MELALRSAAGEVVVTLDCDDTYPTEDIPRLARLVTEEGYDLVDGSRLGRKPKAMPWLNYLANAGFALLALLLFVRRLTDLHSGMRAYRKSLIDQLRFDAHGAALPVELLLRPVRMKKRVKLAFIDYRLRIVVLMMRPLERRPAGWWSAFSARGFVSGLLVVRCPLSVVRCQLMRAGGSYSPPNEH